MKHKKRLVWLVAVALAAALALSFALLGSAVWDEETAIHIEPKEIESATLIVGSHLIHLSTLSDSIYDLAQRSATDSGQGNLYYKSELAEGAWFNITSATTLEDITTAGTPVTDDEIKALFFTHHTKSDGVTYDLRTGLPVDPRDIYNPYDLESMEELYPLKLQYDLLRETQSESKVGKGKIARAAQFFATMVINDDTIRCDAELAALQVYYNILNNNDGGPSEKTAVQGVMDAVDATRRANVYSVIEAALDAYLKELSVVADTQDEEGNSTAATPPDTALQSAVSDSLNNIRTSKIQQEGKMLSKGTTATTQTRYAYSRALVDDAVAINHAACDVDVANLVTLENIVNDIISNKTAELGMLDGTLIPLATGTYSGGIQAGKNAAYNKAVDDKEANVLLQNIVKENTSLLNSFRNELEFFITAKTQRQATSDAELYVISRRNLTKGWYPLVPNDSFRDAAISTVDAHVDFLTRLHRKLQLSAGSNPMDALLTKKDKLQEEMMSFLDNGDLEGAKVVEAKIKAVDAEIAAQSKDTTDNLAALNSKLSDLQKKVDEALASGDDAAAKALGAEVGALKTDISAFSAALPEGSVGAQVVALRQTGLAAVADGNTGAALDSVNALNGLMGMDSSLVLPALKDLHGAMARAKELDGNTAFDGVLTAVEDAILNNADAYAASRRTALNADDLEGIAQQYFDQRSGGDSPLDSAAAGATGSGATGSGATGSGATPGGQRPTPGSGEGASVGSFTGQGGVTVPTGDQVGTGNLPRSAGESAINLIALQMYADETDSPDAGALLQSLALQHSRFGNGLLFLRVDDGGQEYLPVTALSAYTGMRYVWTENQSLATLARGATYYGFTAHSDLVKRSRSGGDDEQMTTATQLKNGMVHVHESYTFQQFGVEAIYLGSTGYGVLCDEALMEEALTLFAQFLDA